MASVKVAVRVRPFNKREIELGCSPIIRMEGKKTCILNPTNQLNPKPDIVDNNEPARKEFTFDYSYWSADQDHVDFVNQEQIYNDLGKEVVEAAFTGYNACIFAYGQTVSGYNFSIFNCQSI